MSFSWFTVAKFIYIIYILFTFCFNSKNLVFAFRGPIKYFESASPELGRPGDGKQTISYVQPRWETWQKYFYLLNLLFDPK